MKDVIKVQNTKVTRPYKTIGTNPFWIFSRAFIRGLNASGRQGMQFLMQVLVLPMNDKYTLRDALVGLNEKAVVSMKVCGRV